MSEIKMMWAYIQAFTDNHTGTTRDERGMTTEAVLLTAGLAVLALAAIAVISQKVLSKANSIPTN